jgi:hypothetical protein
MDLDELRPIIPELRSIVYQYVDLHKQSDELDELRELERQKIQREKDVKQCLCDNLCHLLWILVTTGPWCLFILAMYFELNVWLVVLSILLCLGSTFFLAFTCLCCFRCSDTCWCCCFRGCPYTCWCCCFRCGPDAREIRYYEDSGSDF